MLERVDEPIPDDDHPGERYPECRALERVDRHRTNIKADLLAWHQMSCLDRLPNLYEPDDGHDQRKNRSAERDTSDSQRHKSPLFGTIISRRVAAL